MNWAVLYRHPHRLGEAGMTLVTDKASAAATKDRLEHRGYLVIAIVPPTRAKPADELTYCTGSGLDSAASPSRTDTLIEPKAAHHFSFAIGPCKASPMRGKYSS
jgi:hypothetical protein